MSTVGTARPIVAACVTTYPKVSSISSGRLCSRSWRLDIRSRGARACTSAPRACKCATASASVPLVIVCTAQAGRSVKVMPHVVASAFSDVTTNRDSQGWQGWYSVPVPSFAFGNESSVPLYAAKAVLDTFQRPSCPGHREELEPLFDEDIGVMSGGMKYIPGTTPCCLQAAAIVSKPA